MQPEIIRHTIWLYLCFTLSLRDVEELSAERGLEISYETVRGWVRKFGPVYAGNLRRLRPRPSNTWHLEEMAVSIAGRKMYLWRAVIMDALVLGVRLLAFAALTAATYGILEHRPSPN